jgi:hypothetical protein
MELLIRITPRQTSGADAVEDARWNQRGDVIEIRPDGHQHSAHERTIFAIIRVPSPPANARNIVRTGALHSRLVGIDTVSLGAVGARIFDPNDEVSMNDIPTIGWGVLLGHLKDKQTGVSPNFDDGKFDPDFLVS